MGRQGIGHAHRVVIVANHKHQLVRARHEIGDGVAAVHHGGDRVRSRPEYAAALLAACHRAARRLGFGAVPEEVYSAITGQRVATVRLRAGAVAALDPVAGIAADQAVGRAVASDSDRVGTAGVADVLEVLDIGHETHGMQSTCGVGVLAVGIFDHFAVHQIDHMVLRVDLRARTDLRQCRCRRSRIVDLVELQILDAHGVAVRGGSNQGQLSRGRIKGARDIDHIAIGGGTLRERCRVDIDMADAGHDWLGQGREIDHVEAAFQIQRMRHTGFIVAKHHRLGLVVAHDMGPVGGTGRVGVAAIHKGGVGGAERRIGGGADDIVAHQDATGQVGLHRAVITVRLGNLVAGGFGQIGVLGELNLGVDGRAGQVDGVDGAARCAGTIKLLDVGGEVDAFAGRGQLTRSH